MKMANRPRLKTMDDIYGLTESLNDKNMQTTQINTLVDENGISASIQMIDIINLLPYSKHPFKLYDGERLKDMIDSIKAHGVMNPILVRKDRQNKQNKQNEQSQQGEQDQQDQQNKQNKLSSTQLYEILSGHNRVNAATIAGLKAIRQLSLMD